jgi:hypothetical protein
MKTIVETYGHRETESSGRFKQEREAWTSAIWALGQSKITGEDYWVEIETEEQTPDTKVHFIDQSAGYNHLLTYNLEVVDWEQHVDEPMKVVRKKCLKAYPEYFYLLVLMRQDTVINPGMIAQEIQRLRVPFVEIWMLGRTSNSGYSIVRVYPTMLQIDFDVLLSLKDTSQKDFLKRQKRGKRIEFEDLGFVYLPIP